ncbi:hypothetical protein OIU84_027902 [Salix udensis]|uniref:Aminotransferase class I/classII large domain-containing protein n=1 Tax=Salix udensis TaxID=889485 RepID=A0AAD6KDL3_9ROSI|nr:hypothetical protein OIU84_027902 [Salix udensis]
MLLSVLFNQLSSIPMLPLMESFQQGAQEIPVGNVFSYQHLNKVAETARKLGIFVIADEVYAHLAFGNNPYVPMGEFGSIVPKYGIVDSIKSYFNISSNPATFVQAAIPQIFEKTKDDFFSKIINIMREAADVKLNLSLLEDISDDTDFCLKLAREESVIILPRSGCGTEELAPDNIFH